MNNGEVPYLKPGYYKLETKIGNIYLKITDKEKQEIPIILIDGKVAKLIGFDSINDELVLQIVSTKHVHLVSMNDIYHAERIS